MDNTEKKEKTKKEAFLERFSKRNPDLKIDDEDAYYDAIMRYMDEFEEYEERVTGSVNREVSCLCRDGYCPRGRITSTL